VKAPHFEQADMLVACIRRAENELDVPADRIDIDGTTVRVLAGTRTLTMRCSYVNAGNPGGPMALGGGTWAVSAVSFEQAGCRRSPCRRAYHGADG
jgi:hypothetical protein